MLHHSAFNRNGQILFLQNCVGKMVAKCNIFHHNYGELQPCEGLLLLWLSVNEDDKDVWSSLCG